MADDTRWWRRTLALVLGVTVARLVYLALACPYDLIEDEAHYWEWSRRLDWSYYSKGPGVALAIRAATELLGSSEFAVRLPPAIAGLVTALAVAALARDITGSRRVGFFAAAAVLLVPMFQIVAYFSTIDGPMVACWAVACWAAWLAFRQGSRSAWFVLGAAVGVGFLFKYTILLLLPGLAFFALVERRRLRPARGWPAMAGGCMLLIALGVAPVLIWNDRHGWPTVHHLLGHLGVAGGDFPVGSPSAVEPHGGALRHLREPLEFIAMQFGMVGPALVLGLIGARTAFRRDLPEAIRSGRLFLVLCAAPVLLFYIAIAFFKEAEGNWAMGAYVTLVALAGWVAADAMTEYHARVSAWLALPPDGPGRRPRAGILRRKPELPAQMFWHWTIVYGVIAGLGMLRIDWFNAALGAAGIASPIPIGRFIGAAEMGSHTRELADQLRRETQKEPMVIARHYGRASQLAFYLRDTPIHVYCASSRMEGRRTQYDLWPDTDLDNPALLGRPAVLVGESESLWAVDFDQVRPLGTLHGDRKRGRPAFLGIGYKGMPTTP